MNSCFVAREIRAKGDVIELDAVILPLPRIAEDAGGKWRVIAHKLCDGKLFLKLRSSRTFANFHMLI